jgi:hypothetical protein
MAACGQVALDMTILSRAATLAVSKSTRREGHAVEGLHDYVVERSPCATCLCSTTFGVDFSMIPRGVMSRPHGRFYSNVAW